MNNSGQNTGHPASKRSLPGRPEPFPAEELKARRQQVAEQIGGAASLLQGAGPVERSERFRQTNEMYYLTGIEVPQAYLLIHGSRRSSTLFLPHRDAHVLRNEGVVPCAEEEEAVRQATGVEVVRPLEDLSLLLSRCPVLYLPFQPEEGPAMYRDELTWTAAKIASDPWDGRQPRQNNLVARLRQQYPGAELRDLSPILDDLRLIKSPREIERMRRAGRMTALAVREAMRLTRPGLREFHLGAAADLIFGMHGAQGPGYRPIIAAGQNIWFTHYWRTDAVLQEGEMVLMDYAPDYGYYTSDIGRAWPVDGRYDEPQRELYSLVTAYHKTLLQQIRSGVTPETVMDEAAAKMKPIIEGTTFAQHAVGEAARQLLGFRGHLSHPVGMAVHDVGRYYGRPMEPGLVISVDPQLWIPEEQCYVRVEDTVVVTEQGIENLTAAAPLDLDEIEAEVGAGSPLAAFLDPEES